MKDTLIAAVEVTLLVAVVAAVAPRGKSRTPILPVEYASFVSFGAPTASAAKAAPAPIAKPALNVAKPAPAASLAKAALPAAPAAKAAAAAPVSAPSGAKQLWGVIDSVDAAAHALAVKDKHGRVHSVALPLDAQVTVGGENKAASPAELKPGDSVTVTHENGTARLVHVRLLFPQAGSVAAAN